MRPFWMLALGLIVPNGIGAQTPQEEIERKVPVALKALEAWENASPVTAERKLRLVYWTPKDREPQPQYRERLTAILEDIQKFYADEMTRLGFGPRTIQLERAADGLLQLHLVRGAKPYSAYSVSSGSEIRAESLPTLRAAGLNPDQETLVIFCNMANWDEDKRTIRQNSPYYAGGNAVSGTAWQVDSAILNLAGLEEKQANVRDGQYGNISLGRYNTIFIGGICHELGHALGLPHNAERPDERQAFGTALMGSGNRAYGEERRGDGRGAFLTLAHGLRLASHPMFSGSTKGMNPRSNARIEGMKVESLGNSFRVTGKVIADPPPYALIGYMDPAGNSDYNARTCTAVPDAEGNFTLEANALVPGSGQEFRIVACQVNGACSTYTGGRGRWDFPYNVARDGSLDLSVMQAKSELTKLIGLVNAGDRQGATAELAAIEKSKVPELVKTVAAGLVASIKGPSQIDLTKVDQQQIGLSDVKPADAKVGWARPMINRVADPSALMMAGGRVFARGIFAHAPAVHRWPLGERWKTFEGFAGIGSQDGRAGCVFTILGDGRELWKSGKLKGGQLKHFKVSVESVSALELRVSDGGDGNAGDWSLWLEPQLKR